MHKGVILQSNKSSIPTTDNKKPILLTTNDVINLRNKRISELPNEKV